MTSNLLPGWTKNDYSALEDGVLIARHRIAETGLFADENLVRILDRHPPEDMSINTMGEDKARFEWLEGERGNTSGKDLLELVKTHRFWINCRKMLKHHPEVKRIVDSIYDELEVKIPGFRAEGRTANLLISSPGAQVYYHVDVPVNMLWHMRGRKRVWIYPHFDSRFLANDIAEQVCAGAYTEDVPYDPSFDAYALVVDPEPGQMVTWPQLTPHRVENLEDLNVSLSTEHVNPRAVRRTGVFRANYFLRNQLNWEPRSTAIAGLVPMAKQKFARVIDLVKERRGKRNKAYTYVKTFRIDLAAPQGFVRILPNDVIDTTR